MNAAAGETQILRRCTRVVTVSKLAELLGSNAALRVLRPNAHDVESDIGERLLLNSLGGGGNFMRRHIDKGEVGCGWVVWQCGKLLRMSGGECSYLC